MLFVSLFAFSEILSLKPLFAKTTPEVGSSPISFEVGVDGDEEEFEEYNTVVYGDVTGKGDPGAIDALAIVKHNTGKIPLKNEVYVEAVKDILAANKSIEQNVSQHTDDKPIAANEANAGVGHSLLDERHDATTYHQHHKDT